MMWSDILCAAILLSLPFALGYASAFVVDKITVWKDSNGS